MIATMASIPDIGMEVKIAMIARTAVLAVMAVWGNRAKNTKSKKPNQSQKEAPENKAAVELV